MTHLKKMFKEFNALNNYFEIRNVINFEITDLIGRYIKKIHAVFQNP